AAGEGAVRAARFEAARARHEAWTLAPGDERAAAARQALLVYFAKAVPGPERDQALRWDLELKAAAARH
ncbi:MAG TPA: hypothetical protein VGU27_04675, partial [Candidatus Eisenbacteria bacterium]|nr:hypothetical protein [Candidatus Eisenbacteria bacterium]